MVQWFISVIVGAIVLANPRDIATISGRLVANPTSIVAPYPGGGTPLGQVQEISLLLEQPYKCIEGEEYGGQRVEGMITREGCVLGALLRSWDPDMLEILFPNTKLGSVTGKRAINAPGPLLPGMKLSDRAVTLVFWPDDTDRHPMFIMWNALPAIKESQEISLIVSREFGLPVLFLGIQDASSRLYSWDLAADINFGEDFGYGFDYGTWLGGGV